MPENIIFVDVETTQYKTDDNKIYHKLMLGVGIYYRNRSDGNKSTKEVYRFTTSEDFWSWVMSKSRAKTILYLISHNAVFDFTVLQHIGYLCEYDYTCQFVYEGGVRFISKWRTNNHTVMILDNSNWFAGKLEKWGNELNLPKLKMPKGLSSQEKWFVYCERDCEILYRLFLWYIRFLKENNLGSWKYTIAASAFTSFRHRFMKHPIYIPDELEDSDIARRSYHGGRTECFKVGEYNNGPYYKLDINSMYPYVMRNFEYPVCFEGRYKNPDKRKSRLSIKHKAIIADCLINTHLPYFVYKKENRNVYPIGRFRTVLCTEEFKLAYDNGWIEKIYDCVIYRKRKIFLPYVDFFYEIKQQATDNNTPLIRAFAKLYLNSLYGKFGQRGFKDEVIGQDIDDNIRVSYGYNIQSGERFTLRQIGHNVIYSEKRGESYNAFCAIASHVTANARLLLYDTILKAKRCNCFYCDTDSIIVNQIGFNLLSSSLSNSLLGYWKIEGIADSISITAPKHYTFGDKIVIKGVRRNAEKISRDTFNQQIWPGFNAILKQGVEVYFNYFQIKTLRPSIISGIVQNTGEITPFIIN
jgi:hypothetical protein